MQPVAKDWSTREIIGPQGPIAILMTAVGVLTLVVLANFAAYLWLQKDTTNLGASLISYKWEILLGLEKPIDWLILGDSSANQGVVPEVLEKTLDGSTVNLATVGSVTAINDSWMLDMYIQRLGAPKNVIIVHVYDVWYRGINYGAVAQIPLGIGFWERLDPPANLGYVNGAKIAARRVIPLYYRNTTLANILIPIKQPNSNIQSLDNGFMAEYRAAPEVVQRDYIGHKLFVRENDFHLSTLNQAALDHIIQLADQYQFDVYLANGPLYEELHKDEGFQMYFAQVRKILSDYANRSDRVHYVLQDPLTFPAEKMTGVDHLTYDAALEYSERLAAEISALKGE